jgi:CRP-like cAMP-binding protein
MKGGLDRLFPSRHVVPARKHLVLKDQDPLNVYCVHSGVCAAYDLLSDGRRQIVALYIAGDIVDVTGIVEKPATQNVVAMNDVIVGSVSAADFAQMLDQEPQLHRLLMAESARRRAMLEAWVSALGRKSAIERMAMFFCEIARRTQAAGLADGLTCALPLSQIDLADILGVSAVHVNRVLKTLREMDLAHFDSGRLEITDFDRLAAIAEFDGNYL